MLLNSLKDSPDLMCESAKALGKRILQANLVQRSAEFLSLQIHAVSYDIRNLT
jgi:hypothetical protein